MFSVYLKALMLIFLAEMGDKTQLMAMSFATKYKVRDILIGIGLGAFLNHGLAIALGSLLQRVIPFEIIYLVAGLVFIIFGLTSLSIDDEDVEDSSSKFGPILTVGMAFFIGELGDKTQLTALALSTSDDFPAVILMGTVTGMVLTGLLGIWVGIKLGSKVPEMQLKIGAASVFMFFGIEKLVSSTYFGLYTSSIMAVIAVSVVVFSMRTRQFIHAFRAGESHYATAAERLQQHFMTLQKGIDDLCLGNDACKGCDGTNCLVGSLKVLVQLAIDHNYDLEKIERFKVEEQLIKKFNINHVEDLIVYINREVLSDPECQDNEFIIEIHRLLLKAEKALK